MGALNRESDDNETTIKNSGNGAKWWTAAGITGLVLTTGANALANGFKGIHGGCTGVANGAETVANTAGLSAVAMAVADNEKVAQLQAELARERGERFTEKTVQDAQEREARINARISAHAEKNADDISAINAEIACIKRESVLKEQIYQLQVQNAITGAVSPLSLAVQRNADSILALQGETRAEICRERDERKCADNSLVNYVNATFYPKLVAGIGTTSDTTPQSTYNPLPCCHC